MDLLSSKMGGSVLGHEMSNFFTQTQSCSSAFIDERANEVGSQTGAVILQHVTIQGLAAKETSSLQAKGFAAFLRADEGGHKHAQDAPTTQAQDDHQTTRSH